MKTINKYLYNIYIAISISIIIRLWLLNGYGDTTLEHEWRILFYNLKNYGILSYYNSSGGQLIPTVFMPPLYAYLIYVLDIVTPNVINLVKSVLIFQILLSCFTVFFFYKINLFFFSKKISLISTYVLIFFPIHIVSCLQISSITIQIFLNIIFLYLILKIIKKEFNYKIYVILGFVSALTMLARGEFILIFMLSLFFLLLCKKINYKQTGVTLLIAIITLSPYLIRNYVVFEKITITKSFGYNLWKGNNIESGIEGSDSYLAFNSYKFDKKLKKLKKNTLYDFNRDDLFLNTSINFIKDNPRLFLERYIKKFLAFTLFNPHSNYPKYNNPLNILPLILLSLVFLLSLMFNSRNKSLYYKYLIFNIFITVAIFSIFFILPRYKLIILPSQILISNFIFIKLYLKYFKSKGV